MYDVLVEQFMTRAGVTSTGGIRAVVEALRSVPYGRSEPRTEEGLIAQWRGTCSTKHALLIRCLDELDPQSRPRLVHRVYRVTQAATEQSFGASAARVVPRDGLIDVHTYAVATFGGREVVIDVTFPGPPWDGTSDMAVFAAQGRDFLAGVDPMASKAELIRVHCDPAVREPFIAALAGERAIDL